MQSPAALITASIRTGTRRLKMEFRTRLNVFATLMALGFLAAVTLGMF